MRGNESEKTNADRDTGRGGWIASVKHGDEPDGRR